MWCHLHTLEHNRTVCRNTQSELVSLEWTEYKQRRLGPRSGQKIM